MSVNLRVAASLTAAFALLFVNSPGRAAAQAKAPAPASKPFLWVIDGKTPTYLFGTIHVPDSRVLALAPSVERAFGAANTVLTEIPMDASTQIGVMAKVMLPSEQRLADVVGPELFDRLSKTVQRLLTDSPPGAASMINAMLARMKPWAAMSQLTLLEFLPDMMAGRQPLDAALWARAESAGKEVAALETVDEQIAVFERFTPAEQKRMLELTLDAMDSGKGSSGTKELIEAYLTGDLASLSAAMTESMKGDRELFARFLAVALDARNVVMAERIRARLSTKPGSVHFIAVGAAHFAGDRGIIALLQKDGLKVTRVTTP